MMFMERSTPCVHVKAALNEACPAGVSTAAKLEVPRVLARLAFFLEKVLCAMAISDLNALLVFHLAQEKESLLRATPAGAAHAKGAP